MIILKRNCTDLRPWLTCNLLGLLLMIYTGSCWTTVAISIERYLRVCWDYSSKRTHIFYTMPIIIGSVIFNIPMLFIYEVDSQGSIHTRELASEEWFINYSLYTRCLLIFVLPVLSIITLNLLTFRKVYSLSSTISNNQR